MSVLAHITFDNLNVHKFGFPNDEVLAGHPLYQHGLEPYGAFEVENSPWVQELEAIESTHPQYRPGFFSNCKHYVICFHDSTFECIAKGFSFEFRTGSVRQALIELAEKM